MTTQADITLALFHVTNTSGPALQTDIASLINAIVDQDLISKTRPLNPSILPQLNLCSSQIAALIALISSTTGGSAV